MNSKVTYRQQFTRCGKQRCRKCREGSGHGPYWYAYWSEKGRTVSKYIGIHLPKDIEEERQFTREEEPSPALHSGMLQPPTPTLRIYLLGQFRIERKSDGEWHALDSRTWHRRRARALLGCLLSNTGRRLGREQIMEMLWPDLDIDLAANRLNGAVHELRQILEPDIARPAASRLLRLERDILELADGSQIWVDTEAFDTLLKQADTATAIGQTERLLEEAAALYRGNYLLEELYSEWAAPRRDALQRAWVGLLLKLAHLRAERKAYVSAIELLDRLRTADPTNETALQQLMLLLTQLDRRGEALQMYRQHVAMLAREYEGEPLPETGALYEALRKGHIPSLYTSASVPAITQGKAQSSSTMAPLTEEEELDSREERSPHDHDLAFIRPMFQLGRHNQSPLIGRDRELETLHQIMLSIEQATINGERVASSQEVSSERAVSNASDNNKLSAASDLQVAAAPTSSFHMASSRPKHRHFLLLKGEIGIGKTRLAEELSLEAYERGWTVAWSRSYEQEGTIPYRPWTELLRTLLPSTAALAEVAQMAAPPGDTNAQHPLKLERLSVLLPELAQFTTTPHTRSSLPIPYEQERLHLWEATLGLLGIFSKSQPLLLVLDDLHWTDESSIELLTYLIHHLRDQRVLLVGTCRDGELVPHHKLRTLMADLQREQAIAILSVLPLTSSQIGTLVSHLPRDVVQSIQTQASGNPFFAEELARFVGAPSSEDDASVAVALQERAEYTWTRRTEKGQASWPQGEQTITTPTQPLSLPEAIAAVLERRLSQLSDGCQQLLGKAAVLGGSFELEQLLPMAPEHDEDTVLDLLEEALNAGLLTEEGAGSAITYHFWHPLIISHLYSRLSAARRALLHRKAADTLKALLSAHPTKAAAIVYHLLRGGGDPTSIAQYAEVAGNQAYALAAYSEAQQYFIQTVQALLVHSVNSRSDEPKARRVTAFLAEYQDAAASLPGGLRTMHSELPLHSSEASAVHNVIQHITSQALSQFPIIDPLRVSRILERVGECSMILGNFTEARNIFECILELRTSERFQRQSLTAASAQQLQQEAQIQALLWREISLSWSLTAEYERAYTSYEQGKSVLLKAGITRGVAWACLLLQYGSLLRLDGNYHEARRYLQEALEMLEQREREELSINRPGKDLLTRTERILGGDPLEIGYAHERLGIVASSLGQQQEASKHMHVALEIYEQSEFVSEMARVCSNLSAMYIIKGENEVARPYIRRSLDLAERVGNLPIMTAATLNLGDVAQRSGDLLEAERLLMQCLALAERINDRERVSWSSAMLSGIQKSQGKVSEAARSIVRAIRTGRAMKSARCIRFALVGLADLRVTQAMTIHVTPTADTHNTASLTRQRLLLHAKSTLQRAIELEGMEIENIIDGKQLLAMVHFLLGDGEAAEQLALQTCKESQEYETTSVSGRAYRLLGLIRAMYGDYIQADRYFEQAIEMCRTRGLLLDQARALHSYGTSLLQRDGAIPTQHKATAEQTQQRGVQYVREACTIFARCHAVIDLDLATRDCVALGIGSSVPLSSHSDCQKY